MLIHLFVDPGQHTGLAFYVDKRLEYYCESTGSNVKILYETIKKITTDIEVKYNCKVNQKQAIIESGYVGENTASSLKLAERRGIAEAIVELLGYHSEYMFAAEWQVILGKRQTNKTKEQSKNLATRFSGQLIKNDNIADAICQGMHYLSLHIPDQI